MSFLRTFILLLACLAPPALSAGENAPPRLMLATDYSGGSDVSSYWVSEKLDGVRGRWDGRQLWTRGGQRVSPPAWFTAKWPNVAMDGELWMGRGRFDEVSALVRSIQPDDAAWRQVRFMVFDLPDHGGAFEARVMRMRTLLSAVGVAWLQPVAQSRFDDAEKLDARLNEVVAAGGEGLMLHHRSARYSAGRSGSLLKYKPFQDAEARVVGHAPGKGKYVGMMGALLVELSDGRRFRLGTGFTDVQRAEPPAIGSMVTYRYNGLTSKGLPRFARFLRVRHDPPPPDPQ
ncbi:DNA ligase [Pseudoxanthomonas sp. UTMC 1351]|uniref:DNA ligase n=1 Tax=Pseudoxanthomonas sp. UTMC 1351 TaxID=2695853 RepID=UPI0034CE1682